MEGAQASNDHYEKILSYLKVGKEEGAKTLTGDTQLSFRWRPGQWVLCTAYHFGRAQQNACFSRGNFGSVVAVTKFKDEAEALEITNDSLYGLGAGV